MVRVFFKEWIRNLWLASPVLLLLVLVPYWSWTSKLLMLLVVPVAAAVLQAVQWILAWSSDVRRGLGDPSTEPAGSPRRLWRQRQNSGSETFDDPGP